MRLSGAYRIKRSLIVRQVLQVGGGGDTALYKGAGEGRAGERGALGGGAGVGGASCEGGAGARGDIGGKEEVFDFVGGVFEDDCAKAQGVIGAEEVYSLFTRWHTSALICL